MQPAEQPDNETQRISALIETGLLDTPSESIFDSLTNAASKLFNMPVSLICLIDSKRVWIKSSAGLEGDNEMQRDIGFCPHTINQQGVFEVCNAAIDDRFHDSPLVNSAPHFLYYAGAPLNTSDGCALGTLCIMDYKQRKLSENEKLQLLQLASITTSLIEAKRHQLISKLAEDYQLGSIVEISPNEIYLIDRQSGRFKYANRSAQLNLACSLNELKQLHWREVFVALPEQKTTAYLETNTSIFSAPIGFKTIQRRPDGSTYPVECRIQGCGTGNSDKEFLIISDDISKRLEAENREKSLHNNIAHINRLNTANVLASGLAHELNQPLTAISQYCGTALSLAQCKQYNNLLLTSLQNAINQAMHAGEVIKRIRAFTEKRQPHRSPVNITKLLNESVSLISHRLDRLGITINTHIDTNLPELEADFTQLQQVILNLIANSIEAMEDECSNHIEIKCTTKDEYKAVLFTISDNGCGLSNSAFEQLTTPSASTKANGTGLGLSICQYIIRSHDGAMWLDESYINGTRIHFTIPSSASNHE